MPHNPQRTPVDYELVYVHDDFGWEQIPDENEWFIWANPDIYQWVSFSHDGPIMLYFFEFIG